MADQMTRKEMADEIGNLKSALQEAWKTRDEERQRGTQLEQEVQNLKMAMGQLQGLVSSTSRQNSELLETVKRLAQMGAALVQQGATAATPK